MENLHKNIIYGLLDTRPGRVGELRYIGQSAVGVKRALVHRTPSSLRNNANTHRSMWIRSLHEQGLDYQVCILEELPSCEGLDEAEIRLIEYYRFIGCQLTNHSLGGGGIRGHRLSELHKKKISEGRTGHRHTAEARAKMSEVKLARSLARGKRTLSSDHSKKIGASLLGRTRPPEVIAKIAARNLGRKASQETREKMSKARQKYGIGLSIEERNELAKKRKKAARSMRRGQPKP